MSQERSINSLPANTRLDNYTIERQIGGGGFSIVYLARESESGALVAIKEYIPRKLAYRGEDGLSVHTRDEQAAENFAHGRRLFFQEASTLTTLRHTNIVNVLNFFRANGTVYMVMAYEQGVSLQDYIKRHNGNLSEALIRTVFPPLLDGLKLIHDNGLLHLDIKPANIYLRPGGNPLLLDFGAVHQFLQSRQDMPTQVITPGFSPIEQLDSGGYIGPWTDIYAIGSTIRACIEGTAPPPAAERRMRDSMRPATLCFKKRYSQSLLAAIDWAMEVDPLLRPQSVAQFIEALDRKDLPEEGAPAGHSMLERITNSLPWTRG